MKPGDVIEKPWGCEEILDLCGAYCVKRLNVYPGHRLSLQRHERKRETMMLLQGAAVLIRGDETAQTPAPMAIGEACVIEPGVVHRVEGSPDRGAVIIEVSTPELDDVVRLEDDYGRSA